MDTGATSGDVDMQGMPTQGDLQKEGSGEATSSRDPDGSRHSQERAIKRQGMALSEELDRATKWIREESLGNKRVIEERELPEQGKRSRHTTIDEHAHVGMVCDVRRMLSTPGECAWGTVQRLANKGYSQRQSH